MPTLHEPYKMQLFENIFLGVFDLFFVTSRLGQTDFLPFCFWIWNGHFNAVRAFVWGISLLKNGE
jgi:hypothetical protein